MPKEIESQSAEEKPVNAENTDSQNTNGQVEVKENKAEEKAGEIDSDKIVEKLKARLGKEQAQKNDALDQLADLKKEFEKLKQQKTVKKLSDDDRSKKELSEKDSKIAELEAEIRHRDAVAEVDGVFKDSGLDVGSKVLDMVTTDNPDNTYSNAQAIIDLINQVREESRKDFLKGTTPKASGVKTPNSGKSLNKMSLMEIMHLKQSDPDTYREKARELGWLK